MEGTENSNQPSVVRRWHTIRDSGACGNQRKFQDVNFEGGFSPMMRPALAPDSKRNLQIANFPDTRVSKNSNPQQKDV